MTRGLLLTLTALAVVSMGVGGVFAFTPSVAPLPDIIIGDQTPLDSLTPGDITTAADTLENQLPSANVFDFPNAFNIFTLVEDQPTGVSGFTSDDQLTYTFIATGAALTGYPATRLTINGTALPDGVATDVALTAATASLDFADVAVSQPGGVTPDTSLGPLTYKFGSGFHPSNTRTAADVTATIIDRNLVSLVVTNQQGNPSSAEEFTVWTVDDGPDALSGIGALQLPTPTDLSGWTFIPALVAPLGSFPGGSVTGSKVADAASDSSVNDLRTTLNGANTEQTYSLWQAPASQGLPYREDGVYRLAWHISSSTATASATPSIRLRYAYGVGFAGNGLEFVSGNFTTYNQAGGRTFNQLLQPIPGLSSLAAADKTINLNFDIIDLDSTIGPANVTFESLEVSVLANTAFATGGFSEVNATDLSASNAAVALTPPVPFGSAAINVAQGPDATITAPLSNGTSQFTDGFGNALVIDRAGIGLVPFAPTAPGRRIYRADYGIDATTNTATLPNILLTVATFPGQIFTEEDQVGTHTGSNTGPASPALTGGPVTLSAYLALPIGLDFGSSIGTQIAASAQLLDQGPRQVGVEEGGSITVSALSITSFPESILP